MASTDKMDELRFKLAFDVQKKTPTERKNHVCTMIAAKKFLQYGGYISEEEATNIQNKINGIIKKYHIEFNEEYLNRIRLIILPFECTPSE